MSQRILRFLMCFVAVLQFSVLNGCSQEPQSKPDIGLRTAGNADSPEKTRDHGQDWPAFLGPNGDSTSIETGVSPKRWTPHPPIVWTCKLGVSYGSPAIAQGRLLQFDRFGDHERLTCLDAETGRELWRQQERIAYKDAFGYNNGPRCCPIVDGDRVYTYGVSGQLSCVALDTGELHWTKNLNDDFSVVSNFFGVASSPFVYDDLLLVMVGGSTPESANLPVSRLDLAEPNGTGIVAFNKIDGQEVYRLGDDLASYSSVTVRRIAEEPTGLAFLRSGLLAWNPKSGQRRFKVPWRAEERESVNASVPVTDGNQILLSEAYEIGSVLLQITRDQPAVVWQDEGTRLSKYAFRAHWSTPILIDGHLYGCSGRNQPDSDFRCIRLSDGDLQWSHRRHERSSVLSVDGYLIVLGEYGRLELIRPTPEKLDVVVEVDLSEIVDPTDRRPLLEHPCWAAPVLSHGLLYVRGKDRLICFDLIPVSNR